MSEEKAVRDFAGFAEDIKTLRFAIRSSLGFSPMRPLERLRANAQVFGERVSKVAQNGANPRQDPQGHPSSQGRSVRILPRPFGFLDAVLGQQQPQQPRQNLEDLTPEEAEKLNKAREEELRRIEAERKKKRLDKIRQDFNFSIEIDK